MMVSQFLGCPIHLAVCTCTGYNLSVFHRKQVELTGYADNVLFLPIHAFTIGTNHDSSIKQTPAHCLLDKDGLVQLEWYEWPTKDSFVIRWNETKRWAVVPTPDEVCTEMQSRLSKMSLNKLTDFLNRVQFLRA